MNRRGSRHLLTLLSLAAVLFLATAGCMTRSTHKASSVVQFLYPQKAEPVEVPQVPTLALPLTVGIAFVPSTAAQTGLHLSEKDKLELMKKISAEFTQYPFVKGIEMIPSAYLRPEGSFDNLNQIRTMYGTEVIALLSYDQVQHTDEGLLSLSYWTLVGAYLVRGEKNDTSTMLDAAVYDIPSRKLLFRAPGLSQITGKATPVNLSEQLRLDSRAGFDRAAEDLVVNLREQLVQFQETVRSRPEEVRIVHQPGYRGGGAAGVLLLALAALLGGSRRAGRRGESH
ncbi:rhombotarget lipoprotein [Desulfuromonas versatilis]|uniref:Rhombotarget lipoprotein n=1 Tax=Desulfuromonas versatilis TaxID=2802975 RepID=A0ABN6DTD7_9BACT|nr:rhombotarget lipoprotein [Desulfuromonas versatilis]BCR03421.1 rhombotarget lipoprotein [Desulfuromonas versatilis]